MAQELQEFNKLSLAEQFVEEHHRLVGLEGADTDEEEEEEVKELELVPLPTIQLPAVVSQALSIYGDTATAAFNRAVCTYKVSELRMAKGACDIISLEDPVSNTLKQFKLNPASLNKYKTRREAGVKDMLRGQRLIEEGKKLQRDAFEDLLRYGTILSIAEHEQEKNKKRKIESEQESLLNEVRLAGELAELEAQTALKKAEIAQARGSK